MSIFSRIMPGHHSPEVSVAVPCSHKTLVPMWDSNVDMGKKDKIARYKCDHCHALLTPEQARELASAGAL
jgi:hypothetical protein